MKKFFLFLLLISLEARAGDITSDVPLTPVSEPSVEAIPVEKIEEKTVSSIVKKISLTNKFVADFNSTDHYRSDNGADEYRENNARVRFFSKLSFGQNWSLNSQANLVPFVKDQDYRSGDKNFAHQGIGVSQLYLRYAQEKYSFFAGKMNLNYGTAWRWDRGIWTYELANAYRQVGKIGVGSVYHAGNAKTTGQYNFNFGFFKNDNNYLDNYLAANDDEVYKNSGRPGDTSILKSYIASLDIKFDFGEKEKLNYHFAYINFGVNDKYGLTTIGGRKNQTGFVMGIDYKYLVSQNYDVDALVEYSKFDNLRGDSSLSEHYVTANIINKFYDSWNLTFGYANRQSDISRVNYGYDQSLLEASMGYEFKKNWFFDRFLIQAGYKNMRNNYHSRIDDINSVGVLLRYYKNF